MTEIPERIGKYVIHGVVGQGSAGVVYAAHDPFADRPVAIKVCTAGDEGDEGPGRLLRKMFFNEAHTASLLDHPNILKILDAGEEHGLAYIAMEFVPGAETLKSHCDPARLLPVGRVIEIGFKCARALDHAHRRGVVHRDIKSTNIMLTDEGDVKIGDFGIAQQSRSDVTQVMGIVGSPLYLSPEQAREEEIGSQSDLYSLGVVLFELLTGRLPFEGPGFSRLITQIINESAPDLRTLRPELPEALAQVIARALEKDPERRVRTGLELATDLARVAAHLDTPVSLTETEKFDLARGLRFFREFTDAEVNEVVRASDWKHCRGGEAIITEGTLDQSFFVIVDGAVAVTKNGRRISTLAKGDCFGEMGYLTRIRRTASIAATDDVTVMQINATMLERASVTCQLRFNKVFLETLIERLARTSEALSQQPTN